MVYNKKKLTQYINITNELKQVFILTILRFNICLEHILEKSFQKQIREMNSKNEAKKPDRNYSKPNRLYYKYKH